MSPPQEGIQGGFGAEFRVILAEFLCPASPAFGLGRRRSATLSMNDYKKWSKPEPIPDLLRIAGVLTLQQRVQRPLGTTQ